jgi:hypothetical protein
LGHDSFYNRPQVVLTVTQLKLTDFWNEPPQRDKKKGQEETYNTCVEAGDNDVRMALISLPLITPIMCKKSVERVMSLEARLETLEKEFISFKEEVKADIRELRTYLFGGFVIALVVSLLVKLLGLM